MSLTNAQKAEYRQGEFNCPGCNADIMDSVSDRDGNYIAAAVIEEDVCAAPPDAQSTFYNCYSATWYITCQRCGMKWTDEYCNY